MTPSVSTLAETLEPPFVAAVLGDTAIVQHLNECERRPSDEMVSMAPSQEGFLGLETARDDNGRWLSVSYWRDMQAYTNWRKACAQHLAELFPESHLESLCHIRVANVEQPIAAARTRELRADIPVVTSKASKFRGTRLIDAFPSIKGLFAHVHAR